MKLEGQKIMKQYKIDVLIEINGKLEHDTRIFKSRLSCLDYALNIEKSNSCKILDYNIYSRKVTEWQLD